MKSCCKPGCTEPRKVSATGKILTMCEQHQREYWNAHKTSDKPSYQKRKMTPKQPKAKSSSVSPRTMANLILNAHEGQFILIDRERGVLWRVTAVQEQIATDAARLNQHVLPILRRAGYRVVVIKEDRADAT